MHPWVVVGLGNPGPGYATHRHNVGAMVVTELARRVPTSFSAPRGLRAEVADTRVSPAGFGVIGPDAARVLLVVPRTYMNESGAAVGAVTARAKVSADQVIVIHDELDLELGQLRIKFGGGDNGHNGLKSIRRHLNTGDFYRVRFGIGRPPGRQDPADFVLSSFSAAQRDLVAVQVGLAADAVETLLGSGLAAAQNTFNS